MTGLDSLYQDVRHASRGLRRHVRLALGASAADLVKRVVMRGLLPVGVGLAAGLLPTLALPRLLRGLLFGVEPTAVVPVLAAAALLSTASLVASYLPARRASRADPLKVLRDE